MADDRTLAEIQAAHKDESAHKIRNSQAIYFKTQEKAHNFWVMCQARAMEMLGITPLDMKEAEPFDDGIMRSGFTVKDVRVEMLHLLDPERIHHVNGSGDADWQIGTYFYKLKPFTKEIDELAYFLSHLHYHDNPIKDSQHLKKGDFRIITNVPWDDSKKKHISIPKVEETHVPAAPDDPRTN